MNGVIVLLLLTMVGLLMAVLSRNIAAHSQEQMRHQPPWVKAVFGDCQSREYLDGTSALWRVAGLGIAGLCILKLVGVV